MTMTLGQALATVAIISLMTIVTRFIVFWIFPADKPTPDFINYLGKVLPTAAIAMIVVYALRNVDLASPSHGLPEAIAIIAIVLVHRWKRNSLLSILVGTILYMILVQQVFV